MRVRFPAKAQVPQTQELPGWCDLHSAVGEQLLTCRSASPQSPAAPLKSRRGAARGMPPSVSMSVPARLGGTPAPSANERLNLSLDELIEERHKEQQQRKRESVKQEKTQLVLKKQQQGAMRAQGEKRRMLAYQNRGIADKCYLRKDSNSSSNAPSARSRSVSIDLTGAKRKAQARPRTPKNRQKAKMKSERARGNDARRVAKNSSAAGPTKMVDEEMSDAPAPETLPATAALIAAANAMRDVISARKGAKLVITLKRKSGARQVITNTHEVVDVSSSGRSASALLPGKLQPKTEAKAHAVGKLVKSTTKPAPTKITFIMRRSSKSLKLVRDA